MRNLSGCLSLSQSLEGVFMEPITRRTLLTGACAILALSGTGIAVAAKSSVRKLPDGRLSVNLKSIPALAKVGGATSIGLLGGVPVAITRSSATQYVAFNLACPHQGVTVMRDTDGWVCSAHQSKFGAEGSLISGPATTGLVSVPIKVSRGVATVG